MNLDEEPVGQRKELGVSEQPNSSVESNISLKAGPLSERTISKDPKIRLAAMPELLKLFATCDNDVFLEYYPYFPKYLADVHPKVQELACEAFLVLLDKCPLITDKVLFEIVNSILEKCIISNKDQIKAKALECLLKLANDVNNHSMIKELLSKRLNLKVNPKVSEAALHILTLLLESFGATCFPMQEWIDSVIQLVTSNNIHTRTRALDFLKEAYKRDKITIINAIEKLKPSQREELKKQFVEKTETSKPLREIKDLDVEEIKSNSEVMRVVSKFDDHWCLQLSEKNKWSDKRDMLEELIKSISIVKIRSEHLMEIGKCLRLLVQDSNLVVSNLALKGIGELAKEFKLQFANCAKQSFELIVQKYKDKKSADEAQRCLENLVFSLRLEEMIEPIKESLNNKSPLIKSKVCMWITNTIHKAEPSLIKVLGLALGPTLSKLTNDASSEVRDAALNCLGILKCHVNTEPKFDKIISSLNSHKQDRIEKLTEQMSCVEDNYSIYSVTEEIKADNHSSVNTKKSNVKKKEKVVSQSKAAVKNKRKIGYEVITEEDIGPAISPGNATKQVFENVPTMILAQFDMTECKERLKGFKYLKEWVQNNPERAQTIIEALIVWLERKFNNFQEENQETMKELLLLFKTICDKCTINKRFAYEVVPMLVEEMKDENELENCIEIALAIAKSANPSYVAGLCIKTASQGDHKIMNGGIQLLSRLLGTYGAGLLPVKVTIEYAKECLGNPLVLSAAVQYIQAIHRIMGDSIKSWLSDLDKETYKLLEIDFNTEVHEEPSVNTKKDSSTKLNIAEQLTPKLISSLSAPHVKTRQEAKAELDKILQSANGIANNGLTPLVLSLKGRMNDSCKNLAKGFIGSVGTLATAVGQGFKQYTKIIIQPLIVNLADKQADIRAETSGAMDKIAAVSGADIIFSSIIQILEGNSIEGKNAALKWILKHKSDLTANEAKILTGPLIALAQEKVKETKELTEQVIGAITILFGDLVFVSAMKDLRPMNKSHMEKILNKFKSSETLDEFKETKQVERSNISESVIEDYKSMKVDNSKFEPSDFASNSFFVDKDVPKARASKPKSRMERCKSPLESSVLSSSYIKKQMNPPRVSSMSSSRSTNDLNKQFRSVRKIKMHEQKKVSKPQLDDTVPAEPIVNTKSDPIKSKESNKFSEPAIEELKKVVIARLENKEGRAELEKKTKWGVNQIKKVNVDKLKKTLKTCIDPIVLEDMFSNQPKKIINVANTLTAAVSNEFTDLLDLLDLLCKWANIKMIEQANAPVIKPIIEFLVALFKSMEETEYKMLDFEISFILPMLCERFDTPNSNSRQQFKELLRITAKLYNPAKVTSYLMNTLETTKNRKTKLECLGLMKEFIKLYDSNKIFIPKDIKSLTKLLDSSDSHLKAESLDILAEIYNSRGDAIWTLTGKLTEKTIELMKKKFNVRDLGELKKSKKSDSFIGDFLGNSRMKPSQRLSISRFNETFYEDSMSLATLSNKRKDSEKEDLLTHSLDKDHLSRSESESLFNATEKLESDISPYVRHKGSQSICSKLQISSMDSSKFQDEDEIEITTLDQALEILKCEAISKRVNALMYLNEKTMSNLEEEKECLVNHSNKLLLTFAEVLKELFDKPVRDIPIRFTKYFMTVVSKICANKLIVQSVNEQCFSLFIEQIFMKLLYDRLDIMGSNNEGQYLIKALNLTVLRVLEFYDPTKLFAILINLFMKYKDVSLGNIKMAKLPSLIAKCILKLAKSISSIIETLNVPKVLLSLHEYLLMIPPSALPKSANDDIGIRMGKTIIYELIKVRGEGIWEDYKIIELHQKPDLHLNRWIHLILGTHYSGSASFSKSIEEPTADSSYELQEICKGLNSPQTFQEAIKRLSQYSQEHPDVDLVQYFSVYPKKFREFVLELLEKYNQPKSMGSTSEPRSSSIEKSNSISEYKSKLELLKQKFDIGNKEGEGGS